MEISATNPMENRPMKDKLIAIAAMATELQDTGAMRDEHNPKWQGLRIAIDQAIDQAASPAPADPIDVQLANIAAGVLALREAAGV